MLMFSGYSASKKYTGERSLIVSTKVLWIELGFNPSVLTVGIKDPYIPVTYSTRRGASNSWVRRLLALD